MAEASKDAERKRGAAATGAKEPDASEPPTPKLASASSTAPTEAPATAVEVEEMHVVLDATAVVESSEAPCPLLTKRHRPPSGGHQRSGKRQVVEQKALALDLDLTSSAQAHPADDASAGKVAHGGDRARRTAAKRSRWTIYAASGTPSAEEQRMLRMAIHASLEEVKAVRRPASGKL